jgi:hypothetical protein
MSNDDFREPFLSPCSRFDTIDPNSSLHAWLMAASLEVLEINSSFSGFFTSPIHPERLNYALNLGFDCPILQRRLNLITSRLAATQRPS